LTAIMVVERVAAAERSPPENIVHLEGNIFVVGLGRAIQCHAVGEVGGRIRGSGWRGRRETEESIVPYLDSEVHEDMVDRARFVILARVW
jgi:hypothetical protein